MKNHYTGVDGIHFYHSSLTCQVLPILFNCLARDGEQGELIEAVMKDMMRSMVEFSDAENITVVWDSMLVSEVPLVCEDVTCYV